MSIEFNNATSVIRYGLAIDLDDLALAAFSIHVWINADSMGEGNAGRIAQKRSSEIEGGWLLFTDPTASLGFRTVNVGGSVEAEQLGVNNAITLNTWHSTVLTYDDTGDRRGHIYVDGVEIGYSVDTAASGANGTDAVREFQVGNNQPQGRTFDGEHAEFGLWDRIITPAEILELAGGACPLFFSRRLILYAPFLADESDLLGHSNTSIDTVLTAHPPGIFCIPSVEIMASFGPAVVNVPDRTILA